MRRDFDREVIESRVKDMSLVRHLIGAPRYTREERLRRRSSLALVKMLSSATAIEISENSRKTKLRLLQVVSECSPFFSVISLGLYANLFAVISILRGVSGGAGHALPSNSNPPIAVMNIFENIRRSPMDRFGIF